MKAKFWVETNRIGSRVEQEFDLGDIFCMSEEELSMLSEAELENLCIDMLDEWKNDQVDAWFDIIKG